MKEELVSVLIPTYNYERYIEECITSVINQTYKNIELIVINDGSTDNTWKKLNEMKEACKQRFHNVIFKSQKNIRINKTTNKLLHLAKGKFYCFLDSDDILKPYAIEEMYKFLHTHKTYALAVGNNEFIDSNSKLFFLDKRRKHTKNKKKALYLNRNQSLMSIRKDITDKNFGTYSTILRENYILNGFLIRASAFKTIGFLSDKAPIWDYYIMLQLSKYYKFKYIDKVLYSYRCHKNNDTYIKKVLLLSDMIKTLKNELKIISKINTKNLTRNARQAIKTGIAGFILKEKIKYRQAILKKFST